jgi:hypothetical protein
MSAGPAFRGSRRRGGGRRMTAASHRGGVLGGRARRVIEKRESVAYRGPGRVKSGMGVRGRGGLLGALAVASATAATAGAATPAPVPCSAIGAGVRFLRLPARARIAIACRGPRCHVRKRVMTPRAARRALARAFTVGDVLHLTITNRGYVPEVVVVRFRNGHGPRGAVVSR